MFLVAMDEDNVANDTKLSRKGSAHLFVSLSRASEERFCLHRRRRWPMDRYHYHVERRAPTRLHSNIFFFCSCFVSSLGPGI